MRKITFSEAINEAIFTAMRESNDVITYGLGVPDPKGVFGTTLGLLVTSGLLRFGPAFENTAWSSLFLLAPLGCVYYPLSILPEWLQILAKGLPLVYIFEEARSILVNNVVNYKNIITALALNLFYFIGAIFVFYLAFYGARKKGTLVNMGE